MPHASVRPSVSQAPSIRRLSFPFLSGKPHFGQLPPKRISSRPSVRPSVEIEFRNRGHSAAAAAATAVSAPDLPKAIGVVQREREEREREGGRMDSAGIWPAVASKRQQGRARAAAAAVAAVRPVWRIDKKSNTFTLAWPS